MKKIFCIIFLLCSKYISLSQPMAFDKNFVESYSKKYLLEKDDSIKVKNLAKLAAMYQISDPALTIKYAKLGAELAEKINYPKGKILCLANSAFCYGISSEFVKATIDVNEGIELSKIYDPNKIIFWNGMLYVIALFQGDANLALKYCQKSLHDPLFKKLSEYEKWPVYMQSGRVYAVLNKLDSAEYYGNIVLKYINKYNNAENFDLIRNSYSILGFISTKKNNLEEALKFSKLAFEFNEVANIYQKLNKIDSAIFYAKKNLYYAQQRNMPAGVQISSKLLANIYKNSNPKLSNEYLNIYIDSREKIFNAEKIKQLEDIKLNQQNNEFNIQKAVTASKNSTIQISLIGIVIIISFFTYFLYRNNQHKQKANHLLSKQKEEINFQRDKAEKALTQLKATQAQLIQSEKLASLGELTAGIAHEIQNPLNFVNNFSEVSVELLEDLKEIRHKDIETQRRKEEDELLNDISQNLGKITLHGKRASSIVKGMLEHSKASSGEKELTDINTLADEYLSLSYHGLRAKDKNFNSDFKTDFDTNLPKIAVIPQDIGRVLLNLINNAFYAAYESKKPNPMVMVTTKLIPSLEGQGWVSITVKDNGNGIPKANLEKIFQPFFTTKPTGQGTGLGLSLAYDIVTKGHGGTLEVESEEIVGTEFIVKLPI